MPHSYTTRTVQIRVDAESTVSAVEIRLSGTRTNMQATRTPFGSKSRIDRRDFDACGSRFVFDEAAELSERPTVQMFGHKRSRASANARQVLQDNTLSVGKSLRDDALADAMVRVCNESILTSRDTPQHTLGGATAVGFEARPCSLNRSLLVANDLRRVESVVRGDGNTLHSQVNTQAPRRLGNFRRVRVDRNVQIELAVSEYHVGAADFPRPQLLTHRRRHLQFARHFPFGADSQSGFAEVSREGERARVIAHGRKLFELMLFVALAGECFGDLGYCVDDVLRWQVGLLTYLIVGRMVQVITAVQFLFSRYSRNQSASFRELAHRRFQLFRDVGGNDQHFF